MRKRNQLTFEELVEKNKQELLENELELKKIEERIDEKHLQEENAEKTG
ncbi:FbpB family small basic protein [Bacillus taeanensis]|uniref:FbpB family small basic protein n=1 Tax=Bacillus taeanensis TaxID=273032 RepID=A0A366XXL6_9BACI|nr:FbpB family small basic protein [Bacillus taeanensis]RBW70872.1 FbpB family small basic protein [Bacillus taeanensis]